MLKRLFFTLLLLFPLAAQAPSAEVLASLNDGPHVLWEGPVARVLMVRQGKVLETRHKAPFNLPLEGLSSLRLTGKPHVPAPDQVPLPERIAAVSDVHGNQEGMLTLLKAHRIIDENQRWTFGKGHLVVVGDTFDRGSRVTETLWLYRSLALQAKQAGGRVHVLLGNHEAMVMRGDLRYLAPKYLFLLKDALADHAEAIHGPESEVGRWLRSLPVALKMGHLLFVHGGISPALLEQKPTLPGLNKAFRSALDEPGKPFLLAADGPVWYRGLVPEADPKRPDATPAEVDAILEHFKVRTILIGHTVQTQITPHHGGKVVAIDADLQTPGKGQLWLWEKGLSYRGLLDGRRERL